MCWYKTSKSNKGILIYIYQQLRELSILPWSKHFVPVGLSASNWSIYKSTFDWSNNCQSKSININVRQKSTHLLYSDSLLSVIKYILRIYFLDANNFLNFVEDFYSCCLLKRLSGQFVLCQFEFFSRSLTLTFVHNYSQIFWFFFNFVQTYNLKTKKDKFWK